MATFLPLIANANTAQIQELPAGDDLNLASSNVVNAVNITATGNVTGGNITTSGFVSANNGWNGTGSGAGQLGGTVMSFQCERNSAGSVGGILAFGNGTTGTLGARMPFAGKLLAATLAATNANGNITVDAYLDGQINSSYRLTGNNSVAGNLFDTQDFSSSPLTFAAGATLGWHQTVVPASANGYVVSYFVRFD